MESYFFYLYTVSLFFVSIEAEISHFDLNNNNKGGENDTV